jgi:hypothetical protein
MVVKPHVGKHERPPKKVNAAAPRRPKRTKKEKQ